MSKLEGRILIKTSDDLKQMREGGKIAARILNLLAKEVKEKITTGTLDQIARREIAKAGGKPSFLGHLGYPAAICTSINNEVVHGIPGSKPLREGDIIGIDLGIFYRGFHNDTAITVGVGVIDYKKKNLLEITQKALDEGLKSVKPGIHLGDIQSRIQGIVEGAGFSVIRDLAGHGVGKELQEPPSIPNFGIKGSGPIIKEGMVLAIEPMVAAGDWHVKILPDGWTVVTADGSNAAHYEHTVAVTRDGYEILTKSN